MVATRCRVTIFLLGDSLQNVDGLVVESKTFFFSPFFDASIYVAEFYLMATLRSNCSVFGIIECEKRRLAWNWIDWTERLLCCYKTELVYRKQRKFFIEKVNREFKRVIKKEEKHFVCTGQNLCIKATYINSSRRLKLLNMRIQNWGIFPISINYLKTIFLTIFYIMFIE